jgi:hypothetical protein
MTGKPLRIKPSQMVFEGTLSNSEHVGSLPPKNPTDQATAMSAQPYDLLDGGARRRQLEDGGIGVLPPEKTFVLEALGSGEQAGINRGGADRGTDLSHGFANCVEKRRAGIPHEMPTVGDLGRVW